jgi:hypothetical protein
MDVTAALLSVAVTVGSITPAVSNETVSAAAPAPARITAAVTSADVNQLPSMRRLSSAPQATTRPPALLPLYASFAALQGFDIFSTSKAVAAGGQEVNPLMKPAAGNSVASLAVKAAATAGSIYFVERAWKQNRKGAVILMTAINVATAAVVAHNTQVARQQR